MIVAVGKIGLTLEKKAKIRTVGTFKFVSMLSID